jgi:hypothetical protein
MPEYLSSRLGDVEATLHDATAALGHSREIHAESEGLRGFFAMVMEAAPLSPIGHVLAPIRRRRPGPGLTPAPAPAYRPPRSGEPERGKGGGGVLSAMQARVLRQHLHDPFPSGAADRRAA